MAPFKLPLDAYILMVPMTYAVSALGAMVYNELKNDPDTKSVSFYENSPDTEVEHANRYHNNPAKRFFDARIKGHESWGVFNNEVKALPGPSASAQTSIHWQTMIRESE